MLELQLHKLCWRALLPADCLRRRSSAGTHYSDGDKKACSANESSHPRWAAVSIKQAHHRQLRKLSSMAPPNSRLKKCAWLCDTVTPGRMMALAAIAVAYSRFSSVMKRTRRTIRMICSQQQRMQSEAAHKVEHFGHLGPGFDKSLSFHSRAKKDKEWPFCGDVQVGLHRFHQHCIPSKEVRPRCYMSASVDAT